MEMTIERMSIEHKYAPVESEFVIRESIDMNYSNAALLLRNMGERKETTSLEREALSTAIRLLQRETSK